MVIHKPEDLHYLQKVIFLARGGYLAFYGKTNSYLEHFGVKNTIEVYSILNEKIQTSQTYSTPEISSLNSGFSPKVKKESFAKQFFILSKRMFRIKLNDRINTLLLLLQAPLIALLSCVIFEKTNLSSLFVMILSTIWFGTNNTARDIVGELSIYTRERMFNLRIDSYLVAKVFTAWIFSFLQLIPFVWIMHFFLTLESPVKIFFFLSLLALCAILMGLILSAMFDNTEKVMTLVPISLIPQVLLSGVMEKIRNGFVEFIILQDGE